MKKFLRHFGQNENGTAGTEYAIIAAFIALAIIAGVQVAGTEASQSFANSAEGIRNAAP